MSEHLVVLMTVPKVTVAHEVARALVGEGLAACVNVLDGVRSVYRWKGEICTDSEALCIAKTTADRFEALRARAVSLIPYEVAEVIALPIVAGSAPYLEWLTASCRAE